MMMLMIAGIAVLAAGLLAIVFGIPVKEFSFGNTVILAGAIAACTGAVLLGLALVVRELQNIARRLGANPTATSRGNAERQSAAGSGELPGGDGFPLHRDRSAPATPEGAEPAAQPSSSPGSPAPWQEEVAARDRGRSRGDAAPEPAPATKPRRNLLFSSSSRKERERASAAGTPDPAKPDPGPAPVVPVSAPAEPAPVTFEDAWPQSERTRSDALRRTRTPSTFAEPAAGAPVPDRPAAARSEEPPAVTVLKSGVVDGMAYSLYSDGSIEAQMPEGMMRFASIDELRSHLDQRP
jgi:hypothetical protein